MLARLMTGMALAACLLLTQGCATTGGAEARNVDPYESINRKVYAFNDVADRYAIRPVAKGYNFVLPQPVRTSIGNFFDNITYPITIVNGFLQGELKQGTEDTVRMLVNSTFGVLGFFDVATKGGLNKHEEDFGLTFGKWGIPQGPYVVLPILGPNTLRSAVGIPANLQLNPVVQMSNSSVRSKLLILWFFETRAALVGADDTVFDAYDPYLFLRDAYLQNRAFLLNGGATDDSIFEEDFGDDFGDDL
jgi:phospholipid-binding lipoprotein MlaA